MDLWPITIAERRSLLSTFESLDDDQWQVQSLSGDWTMRELFAHLILAARPPVRRYLGAMIRTKGNFDRANDELARADARQPTEQLLANYRAVVDHQFSPPGWPVKAELSDVVLHSFDARVPLGLDNERPAQHYTYVMELLFSLAGRSFSRGGRPDVRWVATDLDWSRGDGPIVTGTIEDLALTAAGRDVRLDQLDGDGVESLTAWLR